MGDFFSPLRAYTRWHLSIECCCRRCGAVWLLRLAATCYVHINMNYNACN